MQVHGGVLSGSLWLLARSRPSFMHALGNALKSRSYIFERSVNDPLPKEELEASKKGFGLRALCRQEAWEERLEPEKLTLYIPRHALLERACQLAYALDQSYAAIKVPLGDRRTDVVGQRLHRYLHSIIFIRYCE
ncbi:hypothetical protein F5B20DRAFT_547123 [Whalleya microplaca]|nr:hypothetical protein F5B20DRAFT_547123 [Whalleya microplaca]